jgi:hypothetical protein
LARNAGFGVAMSHSFAKESATSQAVVRASIKRLAKMGDGYKTVIDKSNARLASVYF